MAGPHRTIPTLPARDVDTAAGHQRERSGSVRLRGATNERRPAPEDRGR